MGDYSKSEVMCSAENNSTRTLLYRASDGETVLQSSTARIVSSVGLYG